MNNIFLDFGFIQIYWYSVCICLGMIIGCSLIIKEIKRHNIDENFIINLLFYGILIGLLGARIYYVLFNLDYYSKHILEIFEIWNGGLAIHGGIIAGFVWFLIYTKRYKVSTLKILDITVPGLIIGQSIGRWGNFFNQEAFGQITSYAALKAQGVPEFVINGMKINGVYYEPMFLYESILCLTGFIAMLILRRYRYIKKGEITGFYLIWYSLSRLFIESSRSDSLMFLNFKIAQIVSIILILIGFVLVIRARKSSKLSNLYNEEESNKIEF